MVIFLLKMVMFHDFPSFFVCLPEAKKNLNPKNLTEIPEDKYMNPPY